MLQELLKVNILNTNHSRRKTKEACNGFQLAPTLPAKERRCSYSERCFYSESCNGFHDHTFPSETRAAVRYFGTQNTSPHCHVIIAGEFECDLLNAVGFTYMHRSESGNWRKQVVLAGNLPTRGQKLNRSRQATFEVLVRASSEAPSYTTDITL